MQNKDHRYLIDKTESLEKGIAVFPSIYIEASAACGKTTAVHMLLERHPEAVAEWLQMDKELVYPERLAAKLTELGEKMQKERLWVIFESMPGEVSTDTAEQLMDLVMQLPDHCRVIFVSRERPQAELLELLWKRKLELIPGEALLFTPEEVRRLAEERQVWLDPEEISRLTGGWPGCVDMLLRLAAQDVEYGRRQEKAEELLDRYEMKDYIRKEILDTLSEEEHGMLLHAAAWPWLKEELCEEVWGMQYASELFETLGRKGLLFYEHAEKRWKIVSLFRRYILPAEEAAEKVGSWYEKNGYLAEALQCLRRAENRSAYYDCLVKHYDEVPFLGESYAEVMDLPDSLPQLCYLRGMYCYSVQKLEGMDREIQNLKKMEQDSRLVQEILLNLLFVKPDFWLDDWLAALEEKAQKYPGIRLYGILGSSFTCLCGLRDLSGMFSCTKREENRRAKVWRDNLGEEAWKYYKLARLEYYMDTERSNMIHAEEWNVLEKGAQEAWQLRLGMFYVLCRIRTVFQDEEMEEHICQLRDTLRKENNAVCVRNTEAVDHLFSLWSKEPEKLTRWLRNGGAENRIEIKEDNYAMLCCMTKGYLFLSQYEKAGRILRRLIPYVQRYHRNRLLAELLFQQAIVYWAEDRHSQALRSMIESFQVNGSSHYVRFYAGYGKKGRDVLEAYVEWLKKNTPEGWHRKKKYNYGNVLRMPVADYMEVVLRCARKSVLSGYADRNEEIRERFTMMEISVLQGIGSGMTNEELCAELNLKLSTVKSHIYSLYKKMEVNSRVQAILKGKELGILK